MPLGALEQIVHSPQVEVLVVVRPSDEAADGPQP
jgi:hypothetical protein